MIRVADLHKRFGPTRAVAGVSFTIERGEVVGFLGPNGAGKTTTIRVLTGFHPATSGVAEVAGFDVSTRSLDVRRNIGYLPQEVPIYPDLRVVEYLHYRAALKGVPRKERRAAVDRAMDKAGIREVARKLCGHVSHGYRQRVGLADALVANPPILILDEPTSGLDPNQRRRIKQVVRDLANDHTILFSSHILAEVHEVSPRVIIIHRGRVRADGPVDELVGQQVRARLEIAARMPAADLTALAGSLPGVVRDTIAVNADGGTRDEVATLRCAIEPGQDPTAAAGERLLAAGAAVAQLRVVRPTLEEFFYAVTEGADRAEEQANDDEAARADGALAATAAGDDAGALR